jgi:hypothetical protein
MGFLICGIYDERPEVCKKYPQPGSYVPEGCGYWFDAEGKRGGECDPACQASCCQLPRAGGEPGGAPLPEIAGGEPCKHLVYVERHPALPSDGETDTESTGDRKGDRQEPNPVELALAEINRR